MDLDPVPGIGPMMLPIFGDQNEQQSSHPQQPVDSFNLPITEPLVFPEDKVSELLEKAAEYGVEGLQKVFDIVGNMFGHPEYVISTSEAWGVEASKYINNSTADLEYATSRLRFYWEGDAYKAFKDYSASLQTVSDEIPRHFGKIATLIRDSLSRIIEQYNIVIEIIDAFYEFITSVTAELVSLADLVDILDVVPSIVDHFHQFKNTLMDKFQQVVNIIEENWRTAQEIREVSSRFPHVTRLAPEVGDPGRWHVEPNQ